MAKKKRAYQAMQSFMDATDPMRIAQIAGRAASMQEQHNQFNTQMDERKRQFGLTLPVQERNAQARSQNASANVTRAETLRRTEDRAQEYARSNQLLKVSRAMTEAERVRLQEQKQMFDQSSRGVQEAILKKIAPGAEPEVQQLIMDAVNNPQVRLTGEMMGEAVESARKAKVRQGAREASAKERARQTQRTAGEVARSKAIPNYRRNPAESQARSQMASIANRIRKGETEHGGAKRGGVELLKQQLRTIGEAHGIDPMEAVGIDVGSGPMPTGAPVQGPPAAAPAAPQGGVSGDVLERARQEAVQLFEKGMPEEQVDALLDDTYGPGTALRLKGR